MRTRPTDLAAAVALTLGLSLLAGDARGQSCPARPYWPTEEWQSREGSVAQSRGQEISALEKFAFELEGSDADRRGIRTDGVVIVHGGYLIYERYGRGFDADHRHIGWSMAKSFTATLTALAVGQNALELDDSICDYVDGLPAENCAIKVVHLLEMGSGLAWKEIYENQSNQESSTLAMLYGQGHRDMARFVGQHRRRVEPGTQFSYSTGETVLLAAVVGAALEPRFGGEFPWPLLFDPIGMRQTAFERDLAGTYLGGSFVYATPRDYAKFGYLWLNDGCWNGRRLLPEGWVERATQVNDTYRRGKVAKEKNVFGRTWQLNLPVPEQNVDQPWPDLPDDVYVASGHWGQSITVVPSRDVVIVRTGDDRDDTFDYQTFVKLALAIASAR
ncbi:MAG: serine hydrolase [Deltaproteobacteria bacterium]|nr:serine hydrolase [Deltaproteobacteria bacterium]